MKVQMGLPMDASPAKTPELRKAMEETVKACRAVGKPAGIVSPTEEALQVALDLGYQVIVGGGDIVFLRTGAAAKLSSYRDVVGKRVAPKTGEKTGGVY